MTKRIQLVIVSLTAVLVFFAASAQGAEYFEELTGYLKKSYIDQERLNETDVMLQKALRSLENAEDSIWVEESYDPTGTTYRVILHERTLVVSEREVDDIDDLAVVLGRVMKFVKKYFTGTNEEFEDLKYATANGLCTVLDPHTNIFTPKEYKEFFVHIEGEICGIGAYIGVRDGKLTIISPLTGTPASEAGLKARDHIVKIDDESTVSMTTQEAVSRIRGKENSEVVLWIKRKGVDPVLKKTIVRKNVTIPSVKAKLLENDIAYIKVISFAHTTARSFLRRLLEMKNEVGGPFKGLVLDLRDNPGGLLDQAVNLADILLTGGDIVMTAHKDVVSDPYPAKDNGFEPKCPIVVLINQGSASGAEILAGALRNNNRAVLLGSRTFGKGSVQQPRVMKDGSCLKLTVYEYLLPGRVSIQNVGVAPDIALDPAVIEEDDIRIFAEDRSFKERLHNKALVSKYAREEKPAFRLISYLDLPDEPLDGFEITESFVNEEFDLDGPQFVAVILGKKLISFCEPGLSFDRIRFLSQHHKEVLELKRKEFSKVVKQLSKIGIDWQAGALPKDPAVAVQLKCSVVTEEKEKPAAEEKEDAGTSEFDDNPTPERKVKITAVLTNKGEKTLWRVAGKTETEDIASSFAEREFLFGEVPPGKSVTRTVSIPIPYFYIPRKEEINVVVSAENEEPLAERKLTIDLPQVALPQLSVTSVLVNGADGKVLKPEAGKKYTLKTVIKNVGEVEVFQGIAQLKNETDPSKAIDLVKGRKLFTRLKPGRTANADFTFTISKDYAPERYDFRLDVYETNSLQGITKEFSIGRTDGTKFEGLDLEPPALSVDISSLLTEEEYVTLKAKVSDDRALQYFMVLTGSRDKDHIDSFLDKVFFRSNNTKGPVTYSARIPLKAGRNIVSAIITDSNDLKTVRSFFIWRN